MKKTYILTFILMAVVSVYLLLKPSNSINEQLETGAFSQKIIDDNNLDFTDTYYFKGDVNNNYLIINNTLWRILSIDKNNNIKIIKDSKIASEEEVEFSDNNSFIFKDSILQKILEEWYQEELKDYDSYIKDNYYCSSYNAKCLSNITAKISIATEEDFNNTFLDNKSFLTDSFDWWIISNNMYDAEEDIAYSAIITVDGEIYKFPTSELAGIRPIITIDGDIETTGKGTIEEPYFIK